MKSVGLAAVEKELELRVEGETQVKLAQSLGISPQYLCDVRRGRRPVTKELAEKLGFEELPRRFVKVRD